MPPPRSATADVSPSLYPLPHPQICHQGSAHLSLLVRVCVCACVRVCVCACARARACVYACVTVCVCVRACVRACVCMCILLPYCLAVTCTPPHPQRAAGAGVIKICTPP